MNLYLVVFRLGLGIFLLISHYAAIAQYSLAGFDINDPHYWYDMQIGQDQSGVLQGEYMEIKYISKTTDQFFSQSHWQANQIEFKGQVYDNIFLLYDIEKDVILMQHTNELKYFSLGIMPIQENVGWFTLDGHFFRNYAQSISTLGRGFFEEIYIGSQVSLLAKRTKIVKIEQETQFVPITKLVIGRDDDFKRFYRKASLWRIFPEQKKEIKKYIRENNLVISKNDESSLTRVIQYCDTLLNKNSDLK